RPVPGKRNRSAEGDAAAEALVEAPGDALDPLGGRVERSDHRHLRGLRAAGRADPRVLQPVQLRLEPANALHGLTQCVPGPQRRHDAEPIVPDLAETSTQLLHAAIELGGKALEMRFLPVLAGHAVLAAIDGDGRVRHDGLLVRVKRGVCHANLRVRLAGTLFWLRPSTERTVS